jgi:hypothetical protein
MNPVMVIAAKGALLSRDESTSIVALAHTIIECASRIVESDARLEEPFLKWLYPSAAQQLRAIEQAINRILVSETAYHPLHSPQNLESLSSLAAFFYVAYFRTARKLLNPFIPSNPTWVRRPRTPQERLRPSWQRIAQEFIGEARFLSQRAADTWCRTSANDPSASVQIGNSTCLDFDDSSIDVVLTSPPYCTRIDYAVATSIELSCIRTGELLYGELRKGLMGTSTVPTAPPVPNESWGRTCLSFLDAVSSHPSKASSTYYLKNHLIYFHSLNQSLREISRVVKPGGQCFIVVQDSFYKEIHNNVPSTVQEMAEVLSLELHLREDYTATRSMSSINSRARAYKESRKNVESVLCFRKTA